MYKKILLFAFILATSVKASQADLEKIENKLANLEKRILDIENKLKSRQNEKVSKSCKCGAKCQCNPCNCK